MNFSPRAIAALYSSSDIPWSLKDAAVKLYTLLDFRIETGVSDWTDKTVDRICDILEGKGDKYLRSTVDYRNHVRLPKY
jgi:hypothetical protein